MKLAEISHKMILRGISVTSLGLSVVFSAASVSMAAPTSLDGLVPVAFSSFTSTMPDEKAAPIVQIMTGALRQTMIEVYATEMIGTTSAYAPKMDAAILGSAAYATGEMDRAIELSVMPQIRPTLATLGDGQSIRFSVDMRWADKSVVEQLPQTSFLASALVSAMRMSGRVDVASLLSLRWVDADAVDKNGAMRASLKSTKYLSRLRNAMPGQWMPWLTRVDFVIDRTGVRTAMSALALPAAFTKNDRMEKPGMIIERVVYNPASGEDGNYDLTNLTFDRFYSAAPRKDQSILRVTFGEWDGQDFASCAGASCISKVDHIPTIHGHVVFSETTFWDNFIWWFRSWIVSEVDTKILLRDLFLFYDRDTHKLAVVPTKSQLPIIIKTDVAFGNGKPFMLDNRVGIFGINLYQRFVGTQITDGLSADLNKSLADADRALSDLIGQIAGGVVR